jgi:hypothetical protein
MPGDKQKIRNKRQQKGKQQKNRPKDDDSTDVDLDKLEREMEMRTKKLVRRRDVVDKPKIVRTKRKKNQSEQSDDETSEESGAPNRQPKKNEKKRPRQNEVVQPTEAEPSPKKRKVLVAKDKIQKNIREVFNEVGKKLSFTYTAGDQAAQTTLQVGKRKLVKKTANNTHAEMGVLEDGMEADSDEESLLTITDNGKIVVTDGNRALKPAEFRTTNAKNSKKEMDHCGYCTFFLTMMNVPTGQPTFQASVQAGAQNIYPLPTHIREHPAIIARALGFENASQFVNEIKEGMEAFYQASEEGRVRNKSEQEIIVEKLRKDKFTKWKRQDRADQKAEKRFNSLLNDVFGTNKTEFLNSLLKPVITELTTIMRQNEKQRADFLKMTK